MSSSIVKLAGKNGYSGHSGYSGYSGISGTSTRIIEIRALHHTTDVAVGTTISGKFRIPVACTVVAVGAYVDTA